MDIIRNSWFLYFIIMILLGSVVLNTIIHINARREIEEIENNTLRPGLEKRGIDITDEQWKIYRNANPAGKLKIYKEWKDKVNEIP